jgi:hypothetical protein
MISKALTSSLCLNYNTTDQLELVTLEGTDKFSSGDSLDESRFVLNDNHQIRVFLIQSQEAAKIGFGGISNSTYWELSSLPCRISKLAILKPNSRLVMKGLALS